MTAYKNILSVLEVNNGLIFQWGNHFKDNNTSVCTLPIAYKQKHLHGFCCPAVQCESGCSAYDLTLTTISLVAYGGVSKRFLSIGF